MTHYFITDSAFEAGRLTGRILMVLLVILLVARSLFRRKKKQ